MKRKYWVMLFAGICAVAFMSGVLAGFLRNRGGSENLPPVENIRAVAMEQETVKYERRILCYKVKIEDGYICIKELFDDGTESEIEKAEINTSVLPYEDVRILKEGIEFNSKDDALMLIENFVS